MGRYTKLWVALGVPAVILGLRAMGAQIEVDQGTEQQVDALVMVLSPILTALGVWAAPNKPR